MAIEALQIATAIADMQSKRALVIGDVMLDQFVDGTVDRISPEAPVPILGMTDIWQMPGGAANVACNLAHLGLGVGLIGTVGADGTADMLAGELANVPAIDFTPITDATRPTTKKTRFRAGGQQILRVDDEDVSAIATEVGEQLISAANAQIEHSDIIILSDYAKGCLNDTVLAAITASAKKAGKKIIADPKRVDFAAYAGVDVLTPNLRELRLAAGSAIDSIDEIEAAAIQLARLHDIPAIMVTLSARGMLLVQEGATTTHVPASAREVFDVSGAGDTVVATLAAAMTTGASPAEVISIANYAAGVAVAKSGTSIVSPGEIIAELTPSLPPATAPYWADICQQWRQNGDRVGFANGCFDWLHPGHIHLLQRARNACDKLIVGVNSDASVKRLKGPARPLQTAEQRAAVIASLPFVDGVAIFDEDTPFELISALQPDLIFKGGDYNAEEVVGGDIARARGGDVVIIATHGHHSTTAMTTR